MAAKKSQPKKPVAKKAAPTKRAAKKPAAPKKAAGAKKPKKPTGKRASGGPNPLPPPRRAIRDPGGVINLIIPQTASRLPWSNTHVVGLYETVIDTSNPDLHQVRVSWPSATPRHELVPVYALCFRHASDPNDPSDADVEIVMEEVAEFMILPPG